LSRERRLRDAKQQRLHRSRRAVLGQDPIVLVLEAEAVYHVFEKELSVADILDPHPSQHLTNDHFDMLVVDVDALQTVNLLNFVHKVALQFLDTAHGKNIVRIQRAVHERLARPDPVFLLDVYVHASRNRVFAFLTVGRFNYHAAQPLDYRPELDHAVDLGHHRGFLRPASFEQLDYARQTAGDVLGLCSFAWDLGDDVTGRHANVFLLFLDLR